MSVIKLNRKKRRELYLKIAEAEFVSGRIRLIEIAGNYQKACILIEAELDLFNHKPTRYMTEKAKNQLRVWSLLFCAEICINPQYKNI